MDTLLTHFRIARRLLLARPGLTAGRLLTLVTIVTAVTSVFTVANATFLRPLPFPDPDHIVRVYLQPPGTTDFADANPLDQWEFERIRESMRTLTRIEGIWAVERAVAGDAEPEAVDAGRVSAGFFDLLGGRTIHGRTFTEAESDAGARVVVLGHGYWTRRFGAQPAAVGAVLLVDREPHTVIGIMNAGFEPAFARSEFWTPLTVPRDGRPAGLKSVQTVGRLAAGGTAAQAQAELQGILKGLESETPGLKGWTAGIVSLQQAQYGSNRAGVVMLLVAVAMLALIAAANLANLTIADVIFRQGEFAVRAALGGSRRAIVAPEIGQASMLAAAGAVGGVVGAVWLVPAVLSLDTSNTLLRAQLTPDWRVVLCAVATAVVVMGLAIAVPVLRLASPGLATRVLASGRRAIGTPHASRVRVALVTIQTALALVLISVGALVLSSMLRAARTDPGFDPANIVTAQLRLSPALFPQEVDRATFVAQVLDRLRATPGVVDAGTTLNPFDVRFSFQTMVHVEDRPSADGQPHAVQFRRVSPGYFETMRIRMISGRAFDAHDRVGSQAVAIVSRSFARRFWAGGDPVGRRLQRGTNSKTWIVIVGVADDVRDVGIAEPVRDTVYTPFFQGSNAATPVGLVVRTANDPSLHVAAIKRAVWEVDPKQPLAHITLLDDFLSASLGPERFRATIVAVCAILGLVLAAIGTYGVTARSVVERAREVGIRIALGGRPERVWLSIAWTSLRGVLAGAAVGSVASVIVATALTAWLPELRSPTWPFSAAAAATLVAIGAMAAFVAARAVVTIEPVRALRAEG
jgi:putative ABC transport system permease protein